MRKQLKQVQGFSLLELMIALVVLGVLLGIGIPSFNSITESTQLRAVTHSLNSATQLARSEALDTRDDTAVCRASVNFDACDFATDWSTGWVVVTLTGADLETPADVTVVRVWEPVDIVVSGAANGFVFNSSGRATTNGDIQIQSNAESRFICVNGSGRVAVLEVNCP